MNKKGFSLIEILAVIALLGAIMLLVVPNITKNFKDSKKRLFYDNVLSIYSSATRSYFLQDDLSNKNFSSNAVKLDVDISDDLVYKVKVNVDGEVVKIYVTNGTYSYVLDKTSAIKKKEIKLADVIEGKMDNSVTLASQLLNDNPTISTRTDFSEKFMTNTANTLYKATENGTDVYYFAGVDFVEEHCEYDGQTILNVEYGEKLNKEKCLSELTLCVYYDGLYYGVTNCSNTTTITGAKWVERVDKPINNWVKFGKWQKDFIRYRGYYSSTSTNYRDYSTMEECTSSDFNYNCSAYKYASKGDDMYWRIIRTNSDGSVRLLYSGVNPGTTEGYIGTGAFGENHRKVKYVGYMYGNSDTTLDEARTNTNDSIIKTYIDEWYENYFTTYTNYLSNDAVYCNDRELIKGVTYGPNDSLYFKAYERLDGDNDGKNSKPSYDCINSKDAFSGNNSEAKLKYPIALMTADEIAYAGGVLGINTPMWYYLNSVGGSTTGSIWWWLLSPFGGFMPGYVFYVGGSARRVDNGNLGYSSVNDSYRAIRPVISLKACTLWEDGNGSASNPYQIEMNGGC